MAITQKSDNSVLIQDVVSAQVTETLIQEAVMLNGTVRDRSAEVGPGMDRLSIGLFSEMTVQDVSETADMTPQTLTSTQAELIMNRHKAIPFSLSDLVSVQAKANLVAEAVKNGAKTLAAEIDNYLLSLLYAGVSAAAPDHRIALTASAPLTDIANARKLLNEANVPLSDRYLVVSPGFEYEILRADSFISAEKYGSAQPIQAGEIGRILGFTVKVANSSQIIDNGFVAMHMDAVQFARQITPKFESERKVLGQRTDYVLAHLYGGVLAPNGAVKAVIYDADGVA